MLKNQILTLTKTGEELLLKAQSAQKAKDIETLTDLGLKCLAQAREIVLAMRHNSLLLYLECLTQLEKRGSYTNYQDFCARNGLEILSEQDFDLMVAEIYSSGSGNGPS